MPNASTDFNRYVLLRRTIDDSDIRGVFGRYPKIEKRVRRNHQRYFLACLRTYEREVWSLNSTRIRILAADGKWLDSGRAVARATAYGRVCLRLRWAATLRSLGMGNPVGVVENCVSELRRLDACEALA